MTANAKTRHSERITPVVKTESKVTRRSAKERGKEALKIKRLEGRKKGEEAARVLNEQLNEKLRNEILKGKKEFGFDREEFIQDYHRSKVADSIDFHKKRLQGEDLIEGFENSPLSQFHKRWLPFGLFKDNRDGKEMKRIREGYDKLDQEMTKQQTDEHLKWKHGEWRGKRRLGEIFL